MDKLENINFNINEFSGSTNKISAQVTASENELLVLSIPFAKGWTAYVDGQKQELLCANIMYCGLMLDKGYHEIQLLYETPGYRLGACISLLGIVFVSIWFFVSRKFFRKKVES